MVAYRVLLPVLTTSVSRRTPELTVSVVSIDRMRYRSLVISGLFLGTVILRVRYLQRRTKRLQEAVDQTLAELTLAVKIAGDARESLKEQALKDGLTGLWNRRAISAMLQRELSRAQRDHFPLTLVMMDLDHFKLINDTHGHPIGDEVIREAARRITAATVLSPYGFAGRYGGEEFLIIFPDCSRVMGIKRAESLRRAVAETPFTTKSAPLSVTCSLGVTSQECDMNADDAVHKADQALYQAKHEGRNCVRYSD